MVLTCLLITFKCLYRLKCPLAGTNKRFLINTIKNTLPSQKEQDQEREQKEDSKEPEPNKSRKEEKPKKRRIHPYTPSFQSRRRVSYSPPRHRNRNQHTKDKHEKRSSKRWGEWRLCVGTSQECHYVLDCRDVSVFSGKDAVWNWILNGVSYVSSNLELAIATSFGTFKRKARCSINLSTVLEQTFLSSCCIHLSPSDSA